VRGGGPGSVRSRASGSPGGGGAACANSRLGGARKASPGLASVAVWRDSRGARKLVCADSERDLSGGPGLSSGRGGGKRGGPCRWSCGGLSGRGGRASPGRCGGRDGSCPGASGSLGGIGSGCGTSGVGSGRSGAGFSTGAGDSSAGGTASGAFGSAVLGGRGSARSCGAGIGIGGREGSIPWTRKTTRAIQAAFQGRACRQPRQGGATDRSSPVHCQGRGPNVMCPASMSMGITTSPIPMVATGMPVARRTSTHTALNSITAPQVAGRLKRRRRVPGRSWRRMVGNLLQGIRRGDWGVERARRESPPAPGSRSGLS
jgi:hypothetical protein